MARTSPPRTRRSIIPPALTLAGWRLGQTWRLLLTAGLGMLAAVVLVSAVPLFSQVAVSAGLRGALASDPEGTNVDVSVHTTVLSPAIRQRVQSVLAPLMQRDLGAYLVGSSQFSVTTNPLPLGMVAGHAPSTDDTLTLLGVNPDAAKAHLTLTAGRLPTTQSTTLEIMVDTDSAQLLHIGVGDSLAYPSPKGTPAAKALTARIVGTFRQSDHSFAFWHGADFAARPAGGPNGTGTAYTALAAAETVMANTEQLQNIPAATPYDTSTLQWDYTLDYSHLTGNNLGDIINSFNAIQIEADNSLSSITGVQFAEFNSGLSDLVNFQRRIFALQVPITLLLLQVLALVIFFVSLMADVVVERQTEAIAVLRSRGASRRQIFGALATQTGGLAVLAGIVGPPLAILGVQAVAARSLAAGDQSALNVLSDPLATIWGIRYFILAAVVGACVAMLISINRAMGLDVLALRRESARTTRRPLWQRLNLDVIFGIIGVTGYISYVVGVSRLSPNVQTYLSVLSLIAPFFLLIAAALLFLRFFPLALNGAAWLAGRGRRAEPMLALAQMARAPRQSLRTTLLLALSTAFTIFTLVFVASQNQHTLDAAAFTVGADLSGGLANATAASTPTPATQEAQYASLP
nr:ABC transporter permease [Ktedonobacterales bacterium]